LKPVAPSPFARLRHHGVRPIEDYRRARANLERVVAAWPTEPAYLDTLAAAQVRAGDPAAALATIARLNELTARSGAPPYVSTVCFAAMAHHASGDEATARAGLAEARRRLTRDNPNFGESTRLVQEAEALVGSQ
jgi:hypothetical protein